MHRRLALAATTLTLVLGIVAACRPVDGGAGGSPSPEASAAQSAAASADQSNAAPAAPTDAPEETPIASTGSDYGY
jgi:hypothetical protein